MKLNTFLSITYFENYLTFYIADSNNNYDIIGEFKTTAGNALLDAFADWDVTFIDFETSSITIAHH